MYYSEDNFALVDEIIDTRSEVIAENGPDEDEDEDERLNIVW